MSWSVRQDMPRLRKAVDSAPSIFNQRPWELLAAADDRVELYSVPDPNLGRMLPREAVISCGAALYNLKLAIQVAGREPSVWLLPGTDPESGLLTTVTGRRTLLASVEVMGGRVAPPTAAEQELYEALWLRRTDRTPYTSLPVPFPILVEMEVAARSERCWLRTLTRSESRRLRRAAIRASAELGATLSGLSHVPGGAYGPAPEDTREPATRPDFWLHGQSARFERHPQLMALSTDDDRPLDWLRAGEALQAALLTGTRFSMSAPDGRSAGYRTQLRYGPLDPHRLRPHPPVPAGYAVEASFLTQFLELADLRHQPRGWPWRTNYTEIPQVAIRVGYAPTDRVVPPAASYRQSPEKVLRPGDCQQLADLVRDHPRVLQRREVAGAVDEAEPCPAEELTDPVRPFSREQRVVPGPQHHGGRIGDVLIGMANPRRSGTTTSFDVAFRSIVADGRCWSREGVPVVPVPWDLRPRWRRGERSEYGREPKGKGLADLRETGPVRSRET